MSFLTQMTTQISWKLPMNLKQTPNNSPEYQDFEMHQKDTKMNRNENTKTEGYGRHSQGRNEVRDKPWRRHKLVLDKSSRSSARTKEKLSPNAKHSLSFPI